MQIRLNTVQFSGGNGHNRRHTKHLISPSERNDRGVSLEGAQSAVDAQLNKMLSSKDPAVRERAKKELEANARGE